MFCLGRLWLSCMLLVGVCAAVSTVAQEGALSDYSNAIAAGDQLLQDGEFEQAVKAYSEAIQLNANDPQGYTGRGDAYRQLKEYAKAQKDYNDANSKSFSGPSTRLQFGRGSLYLERQQLQLAVPDLQAAYDTDPENPAFMFALGKAFALGGAGAEAEELLNDYIEIDNNNAEAYAMRGRAFAAQLDFDLAIADLQTAINLDPTDSDTFFTLGIVRYQEKEYDAATDAMAKSIELYEPEEGQDEIPSQVYLTKASIHEDAAKQAIEDEEITRQLKASATTCDDLLERLGDDASMAAVRAAALFRRGVAERYLGQFATAVRTLSDAINNNPELAEAYFRRGICWLELNEAALAIRDFTTAQNIQFDKPRYYLWHGIALAKQESYYEAIEAYNGAIALSNRYVDAFLNRGHAWMKLEEYDKAIEDFNKCILLEPTNGQHYFKRGVAFALLEDHDSAIRSFTNAIYFDPDLIDSYDWIADEYERTNQVSLAGEYRVKAAELRGEQ